MSKQDKKYKKKFKELQKKYFIPRCDRAHKAHWKKTWAPILRYNPDWDWGYILDIIKYKLELTKLYIATYGHMVDETKNEIVSQITEVLNKFETWDEDYYYESAMDFSKIHTRNYISFSKKIDGKIVDLGKFYYNDFGEKSDDLTYFLDDKIKSKYKQEANIDLKDKKVLTGYGADWDSEENYTLWVQMMQKATEQEQTDFENIFLLLGKYIRNWWD